MRFNGFQVFALLSLVLSVCGCTAQGAHDDSVVGPDLSHNGPFSAAQDIVLTGIVSTATDAPPPVRITIVRGDHEDVATLENVVSYTKPYLAGVTYHAFTPIIAETNADQKAYWIIGLNMTRTPDRSIYTILRYPYGLRIEPGLTSDAFEYLSLDCADLDLARQSQYEIDTTDKSGKAAKRFVPLEAAPPPEAGACEYNSLKEAIAVTPAVFRNYDRLKNESDAPRLSWHSLHVEVR